MRFCSPTFIDIYSILVFLAIFYYFQIHFEFIISFIACWLNEEFVWDTYTSIRDCIGLSSSLTTEYFNIEYFFKQLVVFTIDPRKPLDTTLWYIYQDVKYWLPAGWGSIIIRIHLSSNATAKFTIKSLASVNFNLFIWSPPSFCEGEKVAQKREKLLRVNQKRWTCMV